MRVVSRPDALKTELMREAGRLIIISHYYYTMYFTLAMLIMMTVLLEYIDLLV